MSEAMGSGYARHVGRIGALAVALGVGVAVVSTPGLAWAQTSGSDAASVASSDAESPADAVTGDPADDDAASADDASPVESDLPAADDLPSDDLPAAADAAGDDPDTVDAQDMSDQEPDAAADRQRPVTRRAKDRERTVTVDTKTAPRRLPADDATPVSAAIERALAPARSLRAALVPRRSVAAADRQVAPAPLTRALAVPASAFSVSVAPAAKATEQVRDVMSNLLASVLGPLAGSGPAAPAGASPLMWVLAAATRRDFLGLRNLLFNAAPKAGSQTEEFAPAEPTSVSPPILIAASDPDGNDLSYRVLQGPAHGTVTLNPDTGSLVYDPDDDFATTGGQDIVKVAVSDQYSGLHFHGPIRTLLGIGPQHETVATVTINVAPAPTNAAPQAIDHSYTGVDEGRSLTVTATAGVLGGATDPDNDALTAELVAGPSNGTLVLDPSGAFVYTHDGTETTTDTFTYRASDGAATSEVKTVTITITPVDDRATAVDDTATVTEDGGPTVIDVLRNDTDPDGPALAIASVTQPIHGTVVMVGGVDVDLDGVIDGPGVTYQPDPDFYTPENTPDTFTYTLTNGTTATVSVTVTGVDDPAGLTPDTLTANEDGAAVSLDVLANDSSPDGPLTLAGVSTVAGGALTFTPEGLVAFVPDADSNGVQEVTYTVTDSDGDTFTGTLTIEVNPTDDNAVVNPNTLTANEGGTAVSVDVLNNDSSPDGPLTLVDLDDPTGGTLTFTSGGVVTFEPDADSNGSQTLTYTVRDPQGDVFTSTLTIVVNPAPDAAVLTPNTLNANEGGSAVSIDVLTDDSSPDGPLTLTNVEPATGGTLTFTPEGVVTFVPDADSNGRQTLEYTVTDPQGDTFNSVLTLVVEPAGDTATIGPDTFNVPEDSTNDFLNVLANDSSPDGALTLTAVGSPTHGTVSIGVVDGVRGILYTPAADATTPATFSYTVADADGDVFYGSVTVTVSPTNDDVATAANDAVDVPEDSPGVDIDVLANDSIPDGVKSITVSTPTHGTATVNPDGTIHYQPGPNATDTASFDYTVTDNDGNTAATATVTITITPTDDDPPTATPDTFTVVEDSFTTLDVLANDDIDGGPAESITSVTEAVHGDVTIDGMDTDRDGIPDAGFVVAYRPHPNYHNTETTADTFTYTLSNGTSATVSVIVTPVNDAPVANPTFGDPDPDTGVITGNLNGTDPDFGTTLTYTVTDPGGGVVTVNADGSFTYRPMVATRLDAAATSGDDFDSFTVAISDGVVTTPVAVTVGDLRIVPGTLAADDSHPITVGSSPRGIAVSPNGNLAYVTNAGHGTVSVINTATNTVTNTITVGAATSGPWAVALSPDGGKAYVINQGAKTLVEIDTGTGVVSSPITVGSRPYDLAVSPDGKSVYVTNYNSSTISVIDTEAMGVVDTISSNTPTGVAFSPDGTLAYVANHNARTVTVIDTATRTVRRTIPITKGSNHSPQDLAVSPDGKHVYVANYSDSVSVIDTATDTVSVFTLDTGSRPVALAVSPDGGLVYVANSGNKTVSVIDTASSAVTTIVSARSQEGVVAFGPDGTAYVTNYPDGKVLVIGVDGVAIAS